MLTTFPAEFVAEFPKVEYAVKFAAWLNQPGQWASEVVQKGRTVTRTATPPADTDVHEHPGLYFQDTLLSVGYFGSSQNRKAKLNGVPAPMSY